VYNLKNSYFCTKKIYLATIWKIENELIKKYKHQELFLYNYRKNLWRKYYKKGKEILFAETAYSDVLQINLADLLALNK
jgi:hypothetical protein